MHVLVCVRVCVCVYGLLGGWGLGMGDVYLVQQCSHSVKRHNIMPAFNQRIHSPRNTVATQPTQPIKTTSNGLRLPCPFKQLAQARKLVAGTGQEAAAKFGRSRENPGKHWEPWTSAECCHPFRTSAWPPAYGGVCNRRCRVAGCCCLAHFVGRSNPQGYK